MACPFLKDGQARYCHAAPVRKLILDGPGGSDGGRCASPDYRQCEWAAGDGARQDHCSFLENVRVQYCGASPIKKLVPFCNSQLSCCTSSSYRYCDSYLLIERPDTTTPPANLFYAPNHFWLDAEESGLCHVGVDSFLVDVAGSVEALTFAAAQGADCPALVLTVHGIEWPMSFPTALRVMKVNGRVRSDPARLAADPYGAGWLFEGWEIPGKTRAGLITGARAENWQVQERTRLAREIREMGASFCDGGLPVRGVAQFLSRQQIVYLLQRFFVRRAWAVEE